MHAFWARHDAIARKGRITQAAAVIYGGNNSWTAEASVVIAFKMERLVAQQIEKEEIERLDKRKTNGA